MASPNLFHYATSELSQDAFICWLLAWSDASCAQDNLAMYEAGSSFVRSFFDLHELPAPARPWSVSVERQWNQVDVLAVIDSQWVLLIEDKVDGSPWAPKLEGYRDRAAREWTEMQVLPTVLKTGDQASFAQAKEAGYQVYDRARWLSVLDRHREKVDHATFQDFLDHLQGIEDDVQSFRRRPEAWEPSPRPWRGFFMALKDHWQDAGWGKVNNAAGGFMGFWWGWTPIEGGSLYLQLEEKTLCVKIQVDDGQDQSQLRNTWSRRALDAARPQDDLRLVRPKRFGTGRQMTIAKWDTDYRRVDPEGRIDVDATASLLERVRRFVAELAVEARAPPPPSNSPE